MTAINHSETLSTSKVPSRFLAAGLFLLALVGPLAIGRLAWLGCDPFSVNDASARVLTSLLAGPAFAILGILIFFYRPDNRIGWLSLAIAFCLPGSVAIDLYVLCGLDGTIAAPGKDYAAWFLYSYGSFFVIPLVILLPMVYPTGRFLSSRWRSVALVSLTALFIVGTGLGLNPDFRQAGRMYLFPLENPFGQLPTPSWWPPVLNTVSNIIFAVLRLIAIAALVVRFRRSAGEERQQMKWLTYFLTLVFGVTVLFFNLPTTLFGLSTVETIWFALLVTVSFWGIPIIVGIAIFKYRLYAIDIVINRTLVYGALTLLVVSLYSLIVVGSSRLFHNIGGLPSSLIATGLIAIVFQPARERLQRNVNRLMFGRRDDPYAVLSHLSRQLQTTAVPAETLTAIVETIAGSLKLPYAAIELVEQDVQVGQATVGEPLGETIELPLRYQNKTVGWLRASSRAPGEKFTPQEVQLLADIAAQTGPVASATRLTLALQRSREQLVLAREEERRRIRRDLHDGLGPTLASQTLKLDMVLELLNGESAAAVQHVTQLKGQTQQMVADIRRLVYELRPPALDELGLLEALRSHVAQMRGTNGSLRIAIDAVPEPLPTLPAAIEVAAYRIALEAVTNVIRHAQAHTCRVRFEIAAAQQPATVILTVTDDGSGLPATFHSGVGLTSMRERVAELGGTCTMSSDPNGGTRVTALLPFTTTAQSNLH